MVSPSRSEASAPQSRFTQDFFSLLGLPISFGLELDRLDAARQQLQAVVHPDRFASATESQRRVALQWSTRLNEAFNTLKDPVSRAAYLLELKGQPSASEGRSSLPLAFLEEQMALRESLEEAHALSDKGSREAALAALRASADRALDAAMRDLARLLDDESDWAQASGVLQMVMFLDKFRQEIG